MGMAHGVFGTHGHHEESEILLLFCVMLDPIRLQWIHDRSRHGE
jgi:hypothetical protein